MMKQFLKTCPSEAVITENGLDLVPGGLGLTFGFPGDPKKLKEKSKMKLWKQYFEGKLSVYYVKDLFIYLAERKWQKLDVVKDTSLFKIDSCWSSKQAERRNVGSVFRVNLRAIYESRAI